MLGVLVSNIFFTIFMMRRPVLASTHDGRLFPGYAQGAPLGHSRRFIWGKGTVANFVVSYAEDVGPATSFAIGQGATMVSADLGSFLLEGISRCGTDAKRFLALMFLFFLLGLTAVALAPVISW